MSGEMTLKEAIQHGYDLLKGWKYHDLSVGQKRILYVYCLWSDGASEETAVMAGQANDDEFIEKHLRASFGYDDESVIS